MERRYIMKLTRSIWDSKQYNYLSAKDSILYDEIKDSDDPKDKQIAQFILDKADKCYVEHCISAFS